MANLNRSAKSPNSWSDYELTAYNIKEVNVYDAAAFFELDSPQLPPSTVSEVILNNVEKPDGPLSKDERQFFLYMDLVHNLREPSATGVADFAAFLLRMLNYDDEHCVICNHVEVALPMCYECVYDKLDVSLMDVNKRKLLLLVHEGQYNTGAPYDAPIVIGKAISTFYDNNPVAKEPSCIFALTMMGSSPTFYRIMVTPALIQAIEGGYYPNEQTVALRFVPRVRYQLKFLRDGMQSLENRRIFLQCFEAFKGLVTGKK